MLHDDNHLWNISEIEALTEDEARAISLETVSIKGHTVYMVDFSGYFKYSALVFADGRHIHYANDYELHHPDRTREWLRSWYISTLNYTLWTDDEIMGPLHSYAEYQRKLRYVMSLFPQRRDYISQWFYGSDAERQTRQEKIKTMIYSPIAMAYFLPEDRDFVSRIASLYNHLSAVKNTMESNADYLKSAILAEMYNHEYSINWQGNWDVLSCFGRIKYNKSDNPEDYFRQLGWTQEQRSVFWAARAEYVKQQQEREDSATRKRSFS